MYKLPQVKTFPKTPPMKPPKDQAGNTNLHLAGPGCATFNPLIEVTNFSSIKREYIQEKPIKDVPIKGTCVVCSKDIPITDCHWKENGIMFCDGCFKARHVEKDFWSENEPWGKDV